MAEARIRIAAWITDFSHSRRLRSACGFKSPIDYEHDYWTSLGEGLAAWGERCQSSTGDEGTRGTAELGSKPANASPMTKPATSSS
ncbi:hypothetical protein QF026_008343 [Streptomyces aurantiacus]|nr:hypothetical protein [Streptomyces aurantiacus]